MASLTTKELRTGLIDFVRPSNGMALATIGIDLILHYGFLVGVLLFEPLWLKILCGALAGAIISQLFVIGHDAVHGAYSSSKALNHLLGRIAFLPALHNFGLWRIVHNHIHHRDTNIRGQNSWSPLSPKEFSEMSALKKLLYRLFRSPLGFGPYYVSQRWLKFKLFPRRKVVGKHRLVYWLDFILIMTYWVAWIAILISFSPTQTWGAMAEMVVCGFVIPYAMWNYLMGFTIYFQHTHPDVPWFDSDDEARHSAGQENVTVHVRFPAWYGHLSHNIMDHTAHHVNPKIPLYRLREAQEELNRISGDSAVVVDFTPGFMFRTMRDCKLYDYRNHQWTDFAGRKTGDTLEIISRGQPVPAPAE